MKHLWTQQEIDYLMKNYNTETKEDLCLHLNKSWSAIKNQLFKFKLKRDLGLINLRKSKIENLLDETKEAYYWLGFLVADGHFYEKGRIKLDVAEIDKSQIVKYSNYIECSKIHCYKNMCTVSAQNKDVSKKLREKLGINNRKTYEPIDLSKITNDDLLFSFIIGFIDGDGHIKVLKRDKCNIKLHLHPNWLNTLIDIETFIFKYFNFPKNRVYSKLTKAGYSKLVFSNTSLIKHIFEKIQEFKLPVMERKWNNIKTNLYNNI